LKLNDTESDKSGLVFGFFNQDHIKPELDNINNNVIGLSANNQ